MKIVLFMFAGRKANMEIQKPYLNRLLDEWPQLEIHLWDLTRDPEDARYLRWLKNTQGDRVKVLDHLHPGHPIRCIKPPGRPRRGWPRCQCMKCKPPYEEPYKWYASQGENEAIYVKVDDDVLFLETDNFAHLIEPLNDNPNRIYSANVVNNVVCAKHDPVINGYIANRLALGDPLDPANDRRWWATHTDPKFAVESHEFFLRTRTMMLGLNPMYVRPRPGEAMSINCIAFTHLTMRRLAAMMDDRLGDEGAVDRLLPWIATSFHAAHLSFGPQEMKMDLTEYRQKYNDLAGLYLGEKTGDKTA